MVTQKPRVKLTYEDYRKTPEDMRCELMDGELILAAAPRTTHQRVQFDFGLIIGQFVKDGDWGEVFFAPTDVVFSDADVVQPDILFVSKERAHVITEDNIRGAPDLVVEILSPSTAERDRGYKRDLYERHGVKEYWMADVDLATVTVLRLGDGGLFEIVGTYGEGESFTSAVLAGFVVNVDEVFGV